MLASSSPTDRSASGRIGGRRDRVASEPTIHPELPRTIGLVLFRTHRGELAEAILDSAGAWTCPKLPVLDRVLNILHAPVPDAGSDVPFGLAELIRVAAWFKGEVRMSRIPG